MPLLLGPRENIWGVETLNPHMNAIEKHCNYQMRFEFLSADCESTLYYKYLANSSLRKRCIVVHSFALYCTQIISHQGSTMPEFQSAPIQHALP